MTDRFYVTTAIPFVNGPPHLGHALEFVQADVLARHARRRGRATRFLTGTDDNALKNVQSADAAGVDVASFVHDNGQRFVALQPPLALSNDDFIHTGSDTRHRPTVEWLWRACAEAGDLYRRSYDGWYCAGCERFFDPTELDLDAPACPEHGAALEHVEEENWFFRLSRYQGTIAAALRDGRLRVEPAHRRNEVLAFVEQGLRDFSVSRPLARARGWGIPVPEDPSQVVYVWFDALANYISALGAPHGHAYEQWWQGTDAGERVHVIGKGILRFHAVYWPAILESAHQPWPTTIFVHDYLTVDGTKIGKSLGNAVDPVALTERYGTDALRWWLLREVPRAGDADFTIERLVATANRDLANGIGNFVRRSAGLVARAGAPAVVSRNASSTASTTDDAPLRVAITGAPAAVDAALATFDFRRALDALLAIVGEGNRYIETVRPWEQPAGPTAATALQPLVEAIAVLAAELAPFVPDLAARIESGSGAVLFDRLEAVATGT